MLNALEAPDGKVKFTLGFPKIHIVVLHENRPINRERAISTPIPTVPGVWVLLVVASTPVAPGASGRTEQSRLYVLVSVVDPGGAALRIKERLRCHRDANAASGRSEPASLSRFVEGPLWVNERTYPLSGSNRHPERRNTHAPP